MSALHIKIDRFLETEDGRLVTQLGIAAITVAAIMLSIWYLI